MIPRRSKEVAPRNRVAENVARNVTMSSREIAQLTEKQHAHVLRDIRGMLDALGDDPVLDDVRQDKDSRGYTACFHLSRELTELLLTGYSVPLRLRVIRRLRELEEGASSAPAVPQNLPEALRLAADLAERNSHLQLVVDEQAPKVRALAVLTETDGAVCITDAAKEIGLQPKALFRWMEANRWIAYQPRLQQGVLVHKLKVLDLDDQTGQQKVAEQVLVTRKGVALLAQRLGGGL